MEKESLCPHRSLMGRLVQLRSHSPPCTHHTVEYTLASQILMIHLHENKQFICLELKVRIFTSIVCSFLFHISILHHAVPPPTLLIIREPAHPVELFTTDSLILTCAIQLVPEVDTPVTINSRWTGHSSLTDNQRRVIISELQGLRPMYESSVTFSTLKSSDSGSYICSANVSPLTDLSGGIIESSWSSEYLSISICKYLRYEYNGL